MSQYRSSRLDRLATEIGCHISGLLGLQDLLHLRLVSRHCYRIAIPKFACLLEGGLNDIAVLLTENGLQTLVGLSGVPELRQHIRRLSFLNPRLHYVPHDDPQQIECISGPSSKDHVHDVMTPRQTAFEHSRRALKLLEDIFINLLEADNLIRISLGPSPAIGVADYWKTCGMKPLLREITTNSKADTVRYVQRLHKVATLKELSSELYLVFNGMEVSQFSRKIVSINVEEPLPKHLKPTKKIDSHSRPQQSSILHESYLREVNIILRYCDFPKKEINSRYRPLKWLQSLARSIPEVEAVLIKGCRCFDCSSCADAMVTLYGMRPVCKFSHMTELSIFSINAQCNLLPGFLLEHKSTLRSLWITWSHAGKGHTWKSLFDMLGELTSLEQVKFAQLIENMPTDTSTSMKIMPELGSYQAERTGLGIVASFAKVMALQGYSMHPYWKDEGHLIIGFPPIRHASTDINWMDLC